MKATRNKSGSSSNNIITTDTSKCKINTVGKFNQRLKV